MAAGLILYGVGAANEIHWAGPIIGMGMIGSASISTGFEDHEAVCAGAAEVDYQTGTDERGDVC
jgi:hypothetical protein